MITFRIFSGRFPCSAEQRAAFIINLPFHKILPRFSASVNLISVRFYETDCTYTLRFPVSNLKEKYESGNCNVYVQSIS